MDTGRSALAAGTIQNAPKPTFAPVRGLSVRAGKAVIRSSGEFPQAAALGNCRSSVLRRSKSTGKVISSKAPSSQARRPTLLVAIGGEHDHRQMTRALLDLAEQLKAAC
jgi:hypothetical protein